MGCKKNYLGSSERNLHEQKGAVHTQKLPGSVILEFLSHSATIFKSNSVLIL